MINKASGGMEFQLTISNPKKWFYESDTLNMSVNLEDSAVATGLEKVSFHFNPKERQCQIIQIVVQLNSFHMLARLCSISSKPGFRSMWIESFQMYKLDLEKAEEPEIKLPTYAGS